MPKEYVRGSDYNFVPAEEGSTAFPEDCRLGTVEIRWSKQPQGSVEIGSGDETLVRVLMDDVAEAIKNAKTSDAVVQDAMSAITNFFHTPAIWVHLDRDGCNELIRRLRKARQDAYGRDE